MVWFKVDDDLDFHRKTLAAGNAAMGLWVRAGANCSRLLTDGFISADMASILGTPAQIRALINVELWHHTDKDGVPGYQFHDFLERNPSREKVERDRAAAAERQTRLRQSRRDDSEVTAKSHRDTPRDTPRDTTRDTPRDFAVSHTTPTRPDPTKRGAGPQRTTTRPPATCPRHPSGTDEPCNPCGRARRQHDTWQAPTPIPPTVAQRLAEARALDTPMEGTA